MLLHFILVTAWEEALPPSLPKRKTKDREGTKVRWQGEGVDAGAVGLPGSEFWVLSSSLLCCIRRPKGTQTLSLMVNHQTRRQVDEEGFGVGLFWSLSHPWLTVLMGTQLILEAGETNSWGLSWFFCRLWMLLGPPPEPCLGSAGAQVWPGPAQPGLASLPEPPLPRP